ncbi:MAG: hypothetical protein ACE5NW_02290 [Acidiferrobacterales bacterium]
MKFCHFPGRRSTNTRAVLTVINGRWPEAGLRPVDALAVRGKLSGYHLLSGARADRWRRLGCWAEVAQAYHSASRPEQRFLRQRLTDVQSKAWQP